MDAFDLARLTDFDFENVCKDLLEVELEHPLEIFSPGRDRGIDLRHVRRNGHIMIVQCKHWIRSDTRSFIKRLKAEELPKVQRLKPDRYILATSVKLTEHAKTQIMKDFVP